MPYFAANLKSLDTGGILTRLYCAYGLADLATRKYKSGAKHFLRANLDHCDIGDMMSAQVSNNGSDVSCYLLNS